MRLAIALMLIAAAPAVSAAPEIYRIDPVHTQILFSVSHDGFSNPVGRVHVIGGWLRANPKDMASGAAEVDIDLAGTDMGEHDWNEAVRGSRLLDTADHPVARYISSSIEPHGEREGVMHGALTLHGKTVPVDVAYTLNRQGATVYGMDTRIGFSAHATLDRNSFGITAFSVSIGQSVSIRLEVEGIADPRAVQDYLQTRHKDDTHD